jgi:uncharacterized protein (DUF433 family)/DNA-binding transcriptional MerR regulator
MTNVINLLGTGNRSVGFYTSRDAARLARVPRHRVDDWRREGIVVPTVKVRGDNGEEELGYTFEAIVYLRLLRRLRETDIPLLKAVEALKSLRERFGPPSRKWGDVRLFLYGGKVMVHKADEWELTTASSRSPVLRQQKAIPTMLFGEDFERMRERVDALLLPPKFLPYIEIDPEARSGQPIVRGTTITTSLVYRLRRHGSSVKDIVSSFPVLNANQVKAAVAYETLLDTEALAA